MRRMAVGAFRDSARRFRIMWHIAVRTDRFSTGRHKVSGRRDEFFEGAMTSQTGVFRAACRRGAGLRYTGCRGDHRGVGLRYTGSLK